MTDATKKARRKYEETRIQKKLSLHKVKDKEIIDYLNGIGDLSNYLKNLVLEEMKSNKISDNQNEN